MILATVKVGEFERFWSVFTTDGADLRRTFGSRGARVMRDGDDHGKVWVLFDWDREDYERFLQDPRSREVMAAAGLQGPPEHAVVESVGETSA